MFQVYSTTLRVKYKFNLKNYYVGKLFLKTQFRYKNVFIYAQQSSSNFVHCPQPK